ncbi:hypothetical protein VTK73DRAFT_8031 [Phialemonium thermophilum]|uniref:Tat pathway signal sequence domain protein n=1 Tax=Phialemonium thermophilum TaxID=223376 RepID=A0ABR3WB81_9PEZI
MTTTPSDPARRGKAASVRWLGGREPSTSYGTTFGLPWARGALLPAHTSWLVCTDDAGRDVPLQSWPTAFWADGSVKWTAHAIPAAARASSGYRVELVDGAQAAAAAPDARASSHGERGNQVAVTVTSHDNEVQVDTGAIVATFSRSGRSVLSSLAGPSGQILAEDGRLVLLQGSTPEPGDDDWVSGSPVQRFWSCVHETVVEQSGPVRAVVAVRGEHALEEARSAQPRGVVPFRLRFYFYAGSEAVRVVHTLVYDGQPQTSVIRGLGIRFQVPLRGTALYDRHVRIAGADGGVLAEAVQGVTGLWKDPGEQVRRAQREGRPLPPVDAWDAEFARLHRWVPSWSDYSLAQLSPDGFTAKKRTKPGHSWVNMPGGTKAGGLVYVGSAARGGSSSSAGGLALGQRHFWERYPTSIDIRGAAGDEGEITLWLYSPAAAPMDLRPYHDGLGEESYDDQLAAMQITYEDWEPGLASPYGISRTNEIFLFGLIETPSASRVAQLTRYLREPPLLVASSRYIYDTAALGQYWSPLVDDRDLSSSSSSSLSRELRSNLDFLFRFYQQQIAQRRWYGFWDHGDLMHTYDADRHAWRYDVGGYAWDNSELSPDLWLWTYFLCTGREDAFRAAEALTRHTGEVDVYHIGPYGGLGTRHGVQHWGDSCKQARVSNALYRRVYYFLSGGDERVAELLDETLGAEQTLLVLDPYRKVRTDRGAYRPDPAALSISLGTDWSALASSWFVAWERGGAQSSAAKQKLLRSMAGIARLQNGFVTGYALYDMRTGDVSPPAHDPDNRGVVKVMHLSAVFGLVEICAELISCLADELPPGFEAAWLEYCRYFNAPADEQRQRYGVDFGRLQLRQGHSRLTAYVAARLGDEALARRAWDEFHTTDGYNAESVPWKTQRVETHDAIAPAEEAPWVSTNLTAMYGLAAMQNHAFLKGIVHYKQTLPM